MSLMTSPLSASYFKRCNQEENPDEVISNVNNSPLYFSLGNAFKPNPDPGVDIYTSTKNLRWKWMTSVSVPHVR